jgi:flagellin-like protein
MKQIIYKEDKAVSPIIATILLIAITVVLAATLYTVLGGFTSGLSNSGSATLSASFTNSTSGTSTYSYSIAVSSSSNGGISVTSLEIKVTNTNGSFTSAILDSSGAGKIVNSNSATIYTVATSGLSAGKVIAGTTISIASINQYGPNSISQVSIIDTSSNSVIWTS